MKAIMVMFDSLNRRFLPPYSAKAAEGIKASHFARLSQHTAVFDNSYVGSLPCMPAGNYIPVASIFCTAAGALSSLLTTACRKSCATRACIPI